MLHTKFIEGKPLVNPLKILNTRRILQDNKYVTKLLVQWEGLQPEDSLWVTMTKLQQAYPTFNLEDKIES